MKEPLLAEWFHKEPVTSAEPVSHLSFVIKTIKTKRKKPLTERRLFCGIAVKIVYILVFIIVQK